MFGWFALGIGAFAWFFAGQPLRRIGYEARIEEMILSAAFGVLTSIGAMLALRAVRINIRSAVSWAAILTNVGFLTLAFWRIVRWL